MNRIIIYEKLNIFTLFLSLVNIFFYKQQYFISYSQFIKKYCCSIVKKMSISQIHFINLLVSDAYPKGSEMAVGLGTDY
jgi:hypothetical protein